MPTIKFYSIKSRKTFEINISDVKTVTLSNGRPAAEAIDPDGYKMFKILSPSDAALLGFPLPDSFERNVDDEEGEI